MRHVLSVCKQFGTAVTCTGHELQRFFLTLEYIGRMMKSQSIGQISAVYKNVEWLGTATYTYINLLSQ